MNKLGIHFGYWNQNWNTDFVGCIERCARVGMDILEIAPAPLMEMERNKRAEIKRAAEAHCIELTYSVGLGSQYDLASSDIAVRRAGIQYSQEIMKLIGEMGGKIYSGINYSSWNVTYPDFSVEKERYFENAANSLQEIMVVAESFGIQYCLEVVNRFEQYLLNTAEEALKLVKMVDRPNAKILLDTFHMNIEEDSIEDAIRIAAPYLGHFHIGEANRRLPQPGRMPWDAIIKVLKQVNYQGAFVMEPFIKMGGEVGRDIRVWRDLSQQADEQRMDALVVAAVAFMKKTHAEN